MQGSTLRDPGWILYFGSLAALALVLPTSAFDPQHRGYWVALGAIGVWRYSLGLVHILRAMLFLHRRFPRLRSEMQALQPAATPASVYLLVTSFRIDVDTTASVYRGVLREAMAWPGQTTIVASIVEMADEQLIKLLWQRSAPPERVRLRIVRIAGTGKRDALAQGFRAATCPIRQRWSR
jgi:mannuronan synthase